MGTMGTKLNTKTFSNQSVEKPTTNLQSNLSSDELKKLGSENIGETLNKLSDSNYVDPSKKLRTRGNDKLDKDAFFKLMITQMKNQDPSNPLKPHEMSAQLANFSSLEQMQNMNQTLTEMKNGQKPAEQFQALQLIGKKVSGDSSQIQRFKGDQEHSMQFTMPARTSVINVKVRNAEGDVIRKAELHNKGEGAQSWSWNGKDDNGNVAPAGNYQVIIEGQTADSKKILPKTDFEGLITGIQFTPEGPVLMVGTQTVRLKDVKKIVDGSAQTPEKDQKAVPAAQQDLKMLEHKAEDKPMRNDSAKLMNEVALSRGAMDRLIKETKKE